METPEFWVQENAHLERTFKFKTFMEAVAFINKVAEVAEKHDHHPTIENTHTTVRLLLTTHDAGNIVTEKDIELAKAINELLS